MRGRKNISNDASGFYAGAIFYTCMMNLGAALAQASMWYLDVFGVSQICGTTFKVFARVAVNIIEQQVICSECARFGRPRIVMFFRCDSGMASPTQAGNPVATGSASLTQLVTESSLMTS